MTLTQGVTQNYRKTQVIYIMIHDRGRIIVMKSHQDNFMVGGQHNMRDCIKGFSIRKVEDHCSRDCWASSWVLWLLVGSGSHDLTVNSSLWMSFLIQKTSEAILSELN